MDDDIKTYLPVNFYASLNKRSFNRAIMNAINDASSYYAEMIQDAIDQQFVSSATGKYLIYLGEQSGFILPPNSGLDITALQTLIPTIAASPKQIKHTLEKFVGAFYTDSKTKPNITCSIPGPYRLTDGDGLIIESESGTYPVFVLASTVANISSVDPAEIATIINISQTAVSADVYTDISTGNRYLRLTSQTYGVGAYIRIVGGALQNVLQFPSLRGSNFFSGTRFLAAKDAPYSDVVRLVWDGVGTSPNLFEVQSGDIIVIRGLSNFLKMPSSLLNGSYEVINSGYDYVEFREGRSFVSSSSSIVAYSTSGSQTISVSYPGHGFNSGMRVNVSSSFGMGGIGYGELSQVEAPIVVTSPDAFTYQAGSVASSNSSVLFNSVVPSTDYYAKKDALFSVSGNVVSVFWVGHGLSTGDLVSSVCRQEVGGLTPAELSFIGLPVTVIDLDNFTVTLPVSATSVATGTFFAIGMSIGVSEDNAILITDQKKMRIYDQSEYAYVAEAISGDCKILVPAVPPISRRFLQGSAHLHGQKFPVLDFTRSSLTLDLSASDGIVSTPNAFVLTNPNIRPDFSLVSQYPSLSSGSIIGSSKVFSIGDVDNNGIFPFTSPELLSEDPIGGIPGSDLLTLSFPFRHGLKKNWQFTLDSSAGSGNLSSSQLTGEFIVHEVINNETVSFRAGAGGIPTIYAGSAVSSFDVYQVSSARADGADFYLQFPVLVDPTTLGLVPGAEFSVDRSAGTNVFLSYANKIRQYNYIVTSVVGNLVYFNVGVGAGPFGLIISSAIGSVSGSFGGTVSYFFDKTSAYNIDYIMNNLYAFQVNAQVSKNTAYIGSFLFDPLGKVFPYTLSGTHEAISAIILKGSSPPSVFVPSVDGWPTPGNLFFSYGSSNQEGPVPYYSVISVNGNSQILIDPSYTFKFTHNPGELVFVLASKSPFSPTADGNDYPCYLTGTAAARDTLEALLQDTVACGIVLDWNVLLPRLRYVDPSISPYEDIVYPVLSEGVEIKELPTVI